jgi:hypothetical protein
MGHFRVYGALYGVWGRLGCMGPFRFYKVKAKGLGRPEGRRDNTEIFCLIEVGFRDGRVTVLTGGLGVYWQTAMDSRTSEQ